MSVYESATTYSQIHSKRKHSTSKRASRYHSKNTRPQHKKPGEVEFTAYANPHNHMSAHNWKFDHRTLPWDAFMNRTPHNPQEAKAGHYRKPSEQRARLESRSRMQMADPTSEHSSGRYQHNPSEFSFLKFRCQETCEIEEDQEIFEMQ